MFVLGETASLADPFEGLGDGDRGRRRLLQGAGAHHRHLQRGELQVEIPGVS